VKALARSASKAQRQFSGLHPDRIEVVVGDLSGPEDFEGSLEGSDVLFHTAAHFRDAYKGGRHRRRKAGGALSRRRPPMTMRESFPILEEVTE
jgi:uncharacterized protein YbjT (DUF2867 family)